MQKLWTKDEVVDRRGLTTLDKNNIWLVQDIIALDILNLSGFPNTEEWSQIANEALSQAIAQTGKCTFYSSACPTSEWANVDYCNLVTDANSVIIKDMRAYI